VRTDIVPRPDVRDDELREVVRDAVARPPFAPAFFFCAVVPAFPPLRPAAFTVIVFRAVVFLAVVLRAVVLRAVVFRAVDFFAVDLRAVVFFAVPPLVDFRDAVVFFRDDVALRLVPLERDEELRDDELRDEPRDEEPPDEELREDEPEDDFDDFVSPASARCLLTVRAAISFARFVERPCFFSESLMCSYCRSRFALHDSGMVCATSWMVSWAVNTCPFRARLMRRAEVRGRYSIGWF
jgi:hypothetical protein